jgi:maleylacetate reductase
VLPEILRTLNLHSPYLVISKSLAASNEGKQYLEFLSQFVVGIKKGVGQNSPYEDAIEIAEQVRSTQYTAIKTYETHCNSADSILTLGGGSITDACKLSALLLENLSSPIKREDISALVNPLNSKPPSHVKPPTLPLIFVPTTLSAGEYHSHAGCLDCEVGTKKQFNYPGMTPRWIICDAKLASLTPEWVWLSTGIFPTHSSNRISGLRAVDHACESLCQTIPHDEKYDTYSVDALTLLIPGLLAVKQSQSLEAYSNCQKGAWNAMKPVIAPKPIQLGASHAIGHKLGGVFGVDHGITSCVMLPAVMQWNLSVNGERQKRIVKVFEETGVADVLKKEGVEENTAGGLLKGYIKLLGMPGSLTEVDVRREKWEKLAKESLTDPWTKRNPRKINGIEDMFEIFELAE